MNVGVEKETVSSSLSRLYFLFKVSNDKANCLFYQIAIVYQTISKCSDMDELLFSGFNITEPQKPQAAKPICLSGYLAHVLMPLHTLKHNVFRSIQKRS